MVNPKGSSGSHKFSLTRIPDSRTLQTSVLLVVVSVGLVFSVMLLPEFMRDTYYHAAVESPHQFELPAYLSGLYAASDRSADTRYSSDATFQAYYILSRSEPLAFRDIEASRVYIRQLEKEDFQRDTKKIYEGVVILKALGLLDSKLSDKYYNILLGLTEPHSAFRRSNIRSASVSATAYAFQAISELGKLEQFKREPAFASSIHFVSTLRESPETYQANTNTTGQQQGVGHHFNRTTYGFRDVGTTSEDATISATYFAIQVLQHSSDVEFLKKALYGLDKFVFSAQTADGGFLDKSATTVDELYHGNSTTANTAKALYILHYLRSPALHESAVVGGVEKFFEEKFGGAYKANSYLRAALTRRGVLHSVTHHHIDLEATLYFLRLVEAFPSLEYGIPRDVPTVLLSLSFLLALAAIANFYKPQVSGMGPLFVAAAAKLWSVGKWALVYSVLGALAIKYLPSAAVFIYLAFGAHVLFQFLEISRVDPQGDAFLIALINSTIYIALVIMFLWVSPYVFAQISIFYVLAAWSWVSTFGVNLAAYYKGDIKLNLLFFAAFQSWAFNTIFLFSYLYGRGDLGLVYRVVNTQGQFYVVFVVLPLLSLFFTYFFTALAPSISSQPEPKKNLPKIQ